jgi:hypothetical protein
MALKQDFAHPVNRGDSPDHSRGERTACGLVNRTNNPVPSFARDQFHNVHSCLLVRRLNQIKSEYPPLMAVKILWFTQRRAEAPSRASDINSEVNRHLQQWKRWARESPSLF